MSDQQGAPVLTLPEQPNFMCVNGTTFLIEKLAESPEHLMHRIQEYNKEKLKELQDTMAHHVSQEATLDLERQLVRIDRFNNDGKIKVPSPLMRDNTVLWLRGKQVYETRILLYRPTRITVDFNLLHNTRSWAMEHSSRERDTFKAFTEWVGKFISENESKGSTYLSGLKFDIMVEQDIIMSPQVAAFCTKDNRIYVKPQGVHPHVYSGENKLCTGNTTSKDFWDDPAFLDNFNSINPHSFADSSTTGGRTWRQTLRNKYFKDIRVRNQGGSAWTT